MIRVIRMEIPEVPLMEPEVFADERGYFLERYHREHFLAAGINADFVQDNHSASRKGVLRGLHYQIHHPQRKLVRVIARETYDVAVDLRRSSPTFNRGIGSTLSAEKKTQLWIPPGFAHGFFVLSAQAEIIYKGTDYHALEWERTLLWNDPVLAIDWPLPNDQPPILSEKDAMGKHLSEVETYD